MCRSTRSWWEWLKFSGTHRRMGPLMVPAKHLSSISVKYLFLWRSLDRKAQNYVFSRERKPARWSQTDKGEVRGHISLVFRVTENVSLALLIQIRKYTVWRYLLLTLVHISLNPLNLIRIIDMWGMCLSWSGCAGISSPLSADQAPTQTPVW